MEGQTLSQRFRALYGVSKTLGQGQRRMDHEVANHDGEKTTSNYLLDSHDQKKE